MIDISIQKDIAYAIKNNAEMRKALISRLQASSFILEEEYKRQMPVNKGFARNSVASEMTDDGYKVASFAGSAGTRYGIMFGYPEFVSQGTYDYRGMPDFGYTTGYTRAEQTVKGFGYTIKEKGKKGIRPNKFAYRAFEVSEPKIVEFYAKEIKPLFETK